MSLSDEEIQRLLAKKHALSRWEKLEKWLIKNSKRSFTASMLAASLQVSVSEATAMIQAYLTAQRHENSETVFILKREGRTRAAVWSVGERTVDVRAIGGTLYEDVVVKAKRAFEPDLRHLAERNPRAAHYARRKIETVMSGALVVLRDAVDGYMVEEE